MAGCSYAFPCSLSTLSPNFDHQVLRQSSPSGPSLSELGPVPELLRIGVCAVLLATLCVGQKVRMTSCGTRSPRFPSATRQRLFCLGSSSRGCR